MDDKAPKLLKNKSIVEQTVATALLGSTALWSAAFLLPNIAPSKSSIDRLSLASSIGFIAGGTIALLRTLHHNEAIERKNVDTLNKVLEGNFVEKYEQEKQAKLENTGLVKS